jgi:type II secretory pathway pseudopilin PulG
MTRRGGFTLLEVILATALTVGMMLAVYAFYQQVTTARVRVQDEARLVAQERLVMDRLTDELCGAITYPFLGVGLDGDGGQVRFMSAVVPGPAAWVEEKLADDPVPPEHDVQWVGYRLRVWEDEEGYWHNDGLERTCQRIVAAETTVDGQEITADLIAPAFKYVWLRYYDGSGWVDAWGGGDLPMAVEIHLGLTPLPEGMENEEYLDQYETFRRVVYLPANQR